MVLNFFNMCVCMLVNMMKIHKVMMICVMMKLLACGGVYYYLCSGHIRWWHMAEFTIIFVLATWGDGTWRSLLLSLFWPCVSLNGEYLSRPVFVDVEGELGFDPFHVLMYGVRGVGFGYCGDLWSCSWFWWKISPARRWWWFSVPVSP